MKFREDYKIIFPMNPDIVVIPESENINRINMSRKGEHSWFK